MRKLRGLNRVVMTHLIDGGWVDRLESLLITGQTCLSRRWIACALGHKACRDGATSSITASRSSLRPLPRASRPHV
ncbi:ATP-binding protein [Paracoccus sp. FO-3]|uniref:ATP-binding protein n=1 Tax=Paracoccaceae TaxID=31989 RepID=UPI0035195951